MRQHPFINAPKANRLAVSKRLATEARAPQVRLIIPYPPTVGDRGHRQRPPRLREMSVTHVLEKVEAYQLHGIRGTRAKAQSLTEQQPILTSTRDYPRLVRDIEQVRNAALTPTGSQLQSFGQGLPTSPAAPLAVIQPSTLIEYVDDADLV